MDEIGGGFVIDSDDFGSMKDGKLTVSNDHHYMHARYISWYKCIPRGSYLSAVEH